MEAVRVCIKSHSLELCSDYCPLLPKCYGLKPKKHPKEGIKHDE